MNPMVQRQLKLQPTCHQEAILNEWLWILTGVWNWAIRKIELDAKDGIYHSRFGLGYLLRGHNHRLGMPYKTMRGQVDTAWRAWDSCFKKRSKRPRLKGQRNKLNSIPYHAPLNSPDNNRIYFPCLGSLKFHKQDIPEGKIKQARIIKRASGWYLCLFIDAEPNRVPSEASNQVGIDLGFTTLATLSTGEKIEHPKELQVAATRIAQAQRGQRKQLTARLREREHNRRKDRNHKLSRKLVSENELIAVSKDNLKGLSRSKFGKSVTSASHGQLRQMLAYKCTQSGRRYIEVNPKNSTRACSSCGSLTGPTGWAGLSVRDWKCLACGAAHDRDINAAINTLNAGLGLGLEHRREAVSGTLKK